ncbi:thiamine pyrophosphate-binding protein [Achromobacter sp. SD115]|uniref:Thiamine pyrophosphate enzyme, C-terminal TPP binding domain protein 11 n=2 Tax=Alcaligenaceae TaxID=506 RepID=E3HVX7_ACHXA|nr:thiamine pyrophosphate enzyme, C-terminal TPP binding domain protein 11 [Achromobacter xylosoxidans A8]MBO1014404.1 thiamine pyrophosphate-binding protein [Achromobacter sp. SD115]
MPMTTLEACRAIHAARGDAVVVSTMSAMKAMDEVAPGAPLALSSVPLMGGAAGLALGIALAQPARAVLVLDGDASLLMELGVLATVAGAAPRRYIHFVFANGVQFNGNANLGMPGGGRVDFAAAAMAAGYAAAFHIGDARELATSLPDIMAAASPVLVELAITPCPPVLGKDNPFPEQPDKRFQRMGDEAARLREQLGADS